MFRVLIVEDELIIREGIKSLIDWEIIGCVIAGECSNGLEALEAIQKKDIDIVVTDIKMPIMDGLELIKKISEIDKRVRGIILTAYSDFKYAQKAVRYGVVDFIVKNDFIIELPKAIEQAKLSINEYDMASKQVMSKQGKTLKYNTAYVLEALVTSKIIEDKELITEFSISDFMYIISCCEIIFTAEQTVQEYRKRIEDILNIVFKDHEFFIINIQNNSFTIVVQVAKEYEISLSSITVLHEKTVNMVKQFLDLEIRFGIGGAIDNYNNLSVGMEKADYALSSIVEKNKYVEVYRDESSNNNKRVNAYKINKLIDNLYNKKCELVAGELNNWKQFIKRTNEPFHSCKADVYSLCNILFEEIIQYENSITIEKREVFKKLDDCRTIYHLFKIFSEVLVRCNSIFSEDKKVKSYIVTNIDNYIKQNYTHNINLEQMSNELHVSKSYLSRIYKKKKGITLSEGINRFRIQCAKELLKENKYKIYEIGFMVGFDDAAYFTNIFKKYSSCSPSDYRNNL